MARTLYLSQEPRNKVAKDYGLVGLRVSGWRRDGSSVPQVPLPLVEEFVPSLRIDQQHSWSPFNQPAAIYYANASLLHGCDGGAQLGVCRGEGFDFNSSLLSLATSAADADPHIECQPIAY
jgi:hypothetical protein